MNIEKILKNCPEGRELYCTAVGVIRYIGVEGDKMEFHGSNGFDVTVENDGRMVKQDNVECIIFPSYECRDWNKWAEVLVKDGDIVKLDDGRVVRYCFSEHAYHQVERFADAAEMFKKGDAVLCRDSDNSPWAAGVFIETDTVLTGSPFHVWVGIASIHYSQCIPFFGNEEKICKD